MQEMYYLPLSETEFFCLLTSTAGSFFVLKGTKKGAVAKPIILRQPHFGIYIESFSHHFSFLTDRKSVV